MSNTFQNMDNTVEREIDHSLNSASSRQITKKPVRKYLISSFQFSWFMFINFIEIPYRICCDGRLKLAIY
jgi:hypothetical protein